MSNPFPAWHEINGGRARFDALTATTQTLSENGAASAAGALGALAVFYLAPADLRTSSSRLRLRATVLTNATAPAVTFTVGLYPIASSGGGASTTSVVLGTVVAGSTAAIATPALSTQTKVDSTEFACPAAGFYALAVVLDTNMAASSSVAVRASLQVKAL